LTDPRRIGDILSPALDRLAISDQVRAFRAWSRASGVQVASGARPRAFSRGVLTVECSSSVWANELTYLGGEILRRMDEVAAGHPVRRFRFVVERAVASRDDEAPETTSGLRGDRLASADLQGALEKAEGVRDARLRAAIEGALGASAGESPGTPGDGPPMG
jgi:hypothetical protein